MVDASPIGGASLAAPQQAPRDPPQWRAALENPAKAGTGRM
jgi:hypothetical protein